MTKEQMVEQVIRQFLKNPELLEKLLKALQGIEKAEPWDDRQKDETVAQPEP